MTQQPHSWVFTQDKQKHAHTFQKVEKPKCPSNGGGPANCRAKGIFKLLMCARTHTLLKNVTTEGNETLKTKHYMISFMAI